MSTQRASVVLLVLLTACASGEVEEPSAREIFTREHGPRSPVNRQVEPTSSADGSDDAGSTPHDSDSGHSHDGGSSIPDSKMPQETGAPDDASQAPAQDAAMPMQPPLRVLDPRAIQIDHPYGVAPSAASTYAFENWAGAMAGIGVRWIRNFDTSAGVRPLDTAAMHALELTGILQWSASTPQAFPVNDLPGWRAYVRNLVKTCQSGVKHWEVWNEPPNFSANKSPRDYAKLVIAAHEEMKAIDPTIQLGIATRSNNVNFLDQALLAGAAGHFDFVTVHPYELLDLLDDGWEATFMHIVPTMRRMLAARDPARMNVPIWFTEIGMPVQPPVTPDDQANSVIKAYTLGLAQGVSRIAWFESIDGDSGPFGLVAADGTPRPAFFALKTLIAQLGPNPRYFGWVLLRGKHYAFVFEGTRANVMVTWARPRTTETLTFEQPVQLVVPSSGSEQGATDYVLTQQPIIIVGLPDRLVSEAVANRSLAFPWSGDAPFDKSATYAVAPSKPAGLHFIGEAPTITAAGESARDCSARSSQDVTVDPAFVAYNSVALQISAAVRRKTPEIPAGFNLKYESVNGWKTTGAWNAIPAGDQWHTLTWSVADPQFVSEWGYSLALDSDSTVNSQYLLKNLTVTKP